MDISPEISDLIDEIRNDKTHGASQLARQVVSVLKVAAGRSCADDSQQFLLEQKEIGRQLAATRPAMAPVFNIISILLGAVAGKAAAMDLASLRQFTMARAEQLINDSAQAVAQIAKYGTRLIADGDTIMTYSYSSTVVAVLKEGFNRYHNIEVIIPRSGYGGSGQITVRQLGDYGMPITFIDDTALGLYIPTADKAIVGADRICADGSLVNAVGTYQLALLANRISIPFYVLCETLKFDPRLKSDQVDLEEKEAPEPAKLKKLSGAVRFKNPSFDITPLELVTAIITEKGLLKPEEVTSHMANEPVG